MAGLLDFATDPQSAMMTQMALGLLSAGGPSSRPVSLGQAIGQAGQMGIQGYKDAQMNQINQMKMDELKRRNAFMQNVNLQSPTLAQDAVGAGALDLKDLLSLQTKDKPQLVTVQTPSGPMQRWLRPGEVVGADIGAPVDKESALPWYVKKGANGTEIDPAYADFERTKASFGRPPAQPMAPVAYINENGQTVWGTITDARGKPAANYSPYVQGAIASAKAEGTQLGTGAGESAVKLKSLEKELPGLEKVVTDLSALGKKATYTVVGQAIDTARRQTGMGVGPGAIARKEYIAKVDNEVLPLLRSTFGAQFTQKEGESLKATLGDPNVSPEEKDAVLRSFIQSKRAQIEGMKGTTSPTKPAQTFDAKPPAHQFKGKSMTGPDGKRYHSDGMIWKEVK